LSPRGIGADRYFNHADLSGGSFLKSCIPGRAAVEDGSRPFPPGRHLSSASIAFLLRFLQTHTTGVFIVYRLALAAVVAGLWWLGWAS